jgi:phosphatidylglycerol:prolipoprotein diacylglycerol transferase
MYPDFTILGFDLYTIFLLLGCLMALIILRIYSDKLNFSAKYTNFLLSLGIVAIIFGYFSAVFFQGLYNIELRGTFTLDSETGSTFYGGLIGGVLIFLLLYFVIGKYLFRDSREHIKRFIDLTNIFACATTLAHAFGRIGCLMAGCCYGRQYDGFGGIYMPDLGYKVIPTQLIECVFLFILFGVFSYLLLKKKFKLNQALYFISYGVFRFLIEFVRDDYRGTTFLRIFTPSQLTALLLIIIGIVWWYEQTKYYKNLIKNETL